MGSFHIRSKSLKGVQIMIRSHFGFSFTFLFYCQQRHFIKRTEVCLKNSKGEKAAGPLEKAITRSILLGGM